MITAVAILVITYILIASKKEPQSTIAAIGAAATLLLDIVPAQKAFDYIEFDVIFLLISMMIISHTLSDSGFFDWFSIRIATFTNGNLKLLLFLLGLLTAVSSAFLDNVTTVIIMVPITIKITEAMNINPLPFLISEILFSNIGGTATLIGDPPNLIIGSEANFTFLEFLEILGPVVIIIFFLSFLLLLFLFRDKINKKPDIENIFNHIKESKTIKNRKLAIISLIVLLAVVIGFVLHGFFELEAYVISFTGASILLLFEKPSHAMKSVQWTTILFFVGLFIIIGGLIETGAIALVADKILAYTDGNRELTSLFIIWGLGIISGFIDNIPYATTLVPIVGNLGQVMDLYPLWWSLSLGVCLGGNLTILGASANIVASHISSQNGYDISFLEYMKYSSIIVLISLIVSTAYIFFRFYLF